MKEYDSFIEEFYRHANKWKNISNPTIFKNAYLRRTLSDELLEDHIDFIKKYYFLDFEQPYRAISILNDERVIIRYNVGLEDGSLYTRDPINKSRLWLEALEKICNSRKPNLKDLSYDELYKNKEMVKKTGYIALKALENLKEIGVFRSDIDLDAIKSEIDEIVKETTTENLSPLDVRKRFNELERKIKDFQINFDDYYGATEIVKYVVLAENMGYDFKRSMIKDRLLENMKEISKKEKNDIKNHQSFKEIVF